MKEHYKKSKAIIVEAIIPLQRRLAWINSHETQLDSLSFEKEITGYGPYIDFDNLTHEQTVELIKTFPGNWKKRYNAASITYENEVDSMIVRSFDSAPPPNCRIVEEKVEVLEKIEIKPAHMETKYRIVCNEPEASNV